MTRFGREALQAVLDFVERHNKMDAEPEVAEAARMLSEMMNDVDK